MDKDCYVRKFRFNQSFHLVAAEDFLKALLNSATFQNRVPAFSCGLAEEIQFKQVGCNVLNLSYFDFLEELDIVKPSGQIKGAPDEWVEGI